MDKDRSDAAYAGHHRARESALKCERSGENEQALAWWALAALYAEEAALECPFPDAAGQYGRRATNARYNALNAIRRNIRALTLGTP
jgi:hypothetical protein